MKTAGRSRHPAALAASLLTWSAVGFSAVYWASQAMALPAQPPGPVQALKPVQDAAVDADAIARAMGAQPGAAAPVVAISRWSVKGVAAQADGSGSAVLTDGTLPPRAYRAGAVLPDGTRVLRIERDGVLIARPGATDSIKLLVPSRDESSAARVAGAPTPIQNESPATTHASQPATAPAQATLPRTEPPAGTLPSVASVAAQTIPPSLTQEQAQLVRQHHEQQLQQELAAPGSRGFVVRSLPPGAAQK